MKIKWYGHACFRIEGDGVAVVTDPYTPEVAGLAPVDESADVVIMSSATDGFHSCASMVPGDQRVLNALEIALRSPIEVNGVMFEALRESDAQRKPGRERHLPLRGGGDKRIAPGDLGNPLTDEQLARLRGKVDVLLAPTGGPPTLELEGSGSQSSDLQRKR